MGVSHADTDIFSNRKTQVYKIKYGLYVTMSNKKMIEVGKKAINILYHSIQSSFCPLFWEKEFFLTAPARICHRYG